MYRQLAFASALLLGACTLEPPVPDVVPLIPPAVTQELARLREEVTTLREDLARVGGRVEALEPWTTRIASLEQRMLAPPVLPKGGKRPVPGREPHPLQMVVLAQKAARVYPAKENFWGKSAENTYVWAPGKVFTVYLTWNHATNINLPVGEKLSTGLRFDKDQWDVENKRVGQEPTVYDTITLRPRFEKGEIPSFVVAESGKRFLFHFICGAEGDLSVTFETMPIHQDTSPEPRLLLPKPTP